MILVALATACATTSPTPAATSAGESAESQSIEAALPGIAAAHRRDEGAKAAAQYAKRTDRAGRLLFAWAQSDRQIAWKKLHALDDPDHPFAWADVGMAAIYLEWKTLDQASAALGRALARDPSIAEADVLRARLDLAYGQSEAARVDAQKALALRPEDPFALDVLAEAARAGGELTAARGFYDRARKAWPEDFAAVRGLADLDRAEGKTAAVLEDLDALHRLAPADTALWLESGRLRAKSGDLAGAARDFEEAAKGGAHDPDVLALLARTYRAAGKTADEKRVLEELVAAKPDAASWKRLGDLDEAAGDDKGAMHDDVQAARLAPKDVEVRLAIAKLQAKAGALSDAIESYREVAGERPDARAELSALEARAHLSGKPFSGSVVQINDALRNALFALYKQLLKEKPALAGRLRLRVVVKKDGRVEQEELLDDSIGDGVLAANLYWNAHDAKFPKADAKYVFNFDLAPPRR